MVSTDPASQISDLDSEIDEITKPQPKQLECKHKRHIKPKQVPLKKRISRPRSKSHKRIPGVKSFIKARAKKLNTSRLPWKPVSIAPKPQISIVNTVSDSSSPSNNTATGGIDTSQSLPSPILPEPRNEQPALQEINDPNDSLVQMEIPSANETDTQPLRSTPDKDQKAQTKPILTALLTEKTQTTTSSNKSHEGDTFVTIDLDTIDEIQSEVNRDTMPVTSFVTLPAQGHKYKHVCRNTQHSLIKAWTLDKSLTFF